MTYAPALFKVAKSNSLGEMHLQENTLFVLVLGVKVIQNVQYLPHHMTYAPAKLEVATSNSLGEDAFIGKYII